MDEVTLVGHLKYPRCPGRRIRDIGENREKLGQNTTPRMTKGGGGSAGRHWRWQREGRRTNNRAGAARWAIAARQEDVARAGKCLAGSGKDSAAPPRAHAHISSERGAVFARLAGPLIRKRSCAAAGERQPRGRYPADLAGIGALVREKYGKNRGLKGARLLAPSV